MKTPHEFFREGFNGAEGGGRTRTSVTSPDFESGASANSTTSAWNFYILTYAKQDYKMI